MQSLWNHAGGKHSEPKGVSNATPKEANMGPLSISPESLPVSDLEFQPLDEEESLSAPRELSGHRQSGPIELMMRQTRRLSQKLEDQERHSEQNQNERKIGERKDPSAQSIDAMRKLRPSLLIERAHD